MADQRHWQFWIDTGGTFTDCLARTPDGLLRRLKVLSTGAVRAQVSRIINANQIRLGGLPKLPNNFFAGFKLQHSAGGESGRIQSWDASGELAHLATDHGLTLHVGDIVDLSADEEAPVLAMRILTATTLGAAFPAASLRLATTRGTNALLEGKCARTAFFVTAGFGDLLKIGDQRRIDLFALNPTKPPTLHGAVVEVEERLAADGAVVRPLELEALRMRAAALLQEGYNVAAVALLHGYLNPAHEQAVATLLRDLGFEYVSLSSELSSQIKIVPRAATAVVDAMLSPIMEKYLDAVSRVVESEHLDVMTSAGGLVKRGAYHPKDSLLSGPAGGVAGAASVARSAGWHRIIGFDMGGTSTDVARFEGDFEYRYEYQVGLARVCAPAIRLETVASGGGSICRFDGTALVVGPESAGANPGPACYGAGGPLTLTDVNLLLGRLTAKKFGVPVFVSAAKTKLAEVLASVEAVAGQCPSRDEVLRGFLDIANERMADAIRRISVREGYDPADYALVAFGGAGGLHGCAVAERLGIDRILFPADSGLLSAVGLKAAVSERFAERQVMLPIQDPRLNVFHLLQQLEAEARTRLIDDGVATADVIARRTELELRFSGQESTLTVAAFPLESIEDRFLQAYEARYGYTTAGRTIEIALARVVVSERPLRGKNEVFDATARPFHPSQSDCAVMAREDLKAGTSLAGPMIVQDEFSTLFIAVGWTGMVGSAGSIKLEKQSSRSETAGARSEVVELELFTCRFLSLVEEMGDLLQRCALSVNVKDRRDYSCALLDAEGGLVANAPHIPVHLGALGMCVRCLRDHIEMQPGDVIVTNHPRFGGSHLPDVTLVAPVHDADGKLIGYFANRAHHAEIGGMLPGSMPPSARSLAEEGVVIAPVHLVRGGRADWGTVRRCLSECKYPSRAIGENIADLHAQLASVHRGAESLGSLSATFGTEQIHRFMQLLKSRSAQTLDEAFSTMPEARYQALDSLDDETPVKVCCEWSGGKLRIDFDGSGGVHPGNLNATPAIVHSAVIYVLRLLAGRDLPLNEGLLRDVQIVIPSGLLSPRFPEDPAQCPAVVGGNVETSQRIVDVLLQALGLAACSQGTMNNVTFGNDHFSCYETVGGGAGATPQADGCDAVHTHMTNTAITDPEIMEKRLPVRLEEFSIHAKSGGGGRRKGGDGIVRRITFLECVELSLLAQRRLFGPPGMSGGKPGKIGQQWILRKDGRQEHLAGIAAAQLEAGDQLVLKTPGGGGWGVPGSSP